MAMASLHGDRWQAQSSSTLPCVLPRRSALRTLQRNEERASRWAFQNMKPHPDLATGSQRFRPLPSSRPLIRSCSTTSPGVRCAPSPTVGISGSSIQGLRTDFAFQPPCVPGLCHVQACAHSRRAERRAPPGYGRVYGGTLQGSDAAHRDPGGHHHLIVRSAPASRGGHSALLAGWNVPIH